MVKYRQEYHQTHQVLTSFKKLLFWRIRLALNHIHLSQVHLSDTNLRDCTFISFIGPELPTSLNKHAMVQLGKGQAIIGGFGNGDVQDKIYIFSCMNRNCSIHQLDQVLSMPRYWFVAISIPDTLSGCITGGNIFHKNNQVSLQFKTNSYLCFFRVSVG